MATIDDKFEWIAQAEDAFTKGLEKVDQQYAKEVLKIYAKFLQGGNLTLNAEELAKLDDALIAAVTKTDYKLVIDAYIPNFDAIKKMDVKIHKDLNDIDAQDVIDENLKIKNFQSVVESKLRGTPSTIIEVLNESTNVVEKIPIRNPSLNELIDPIADVIRQDVITGVSFESAAESMLEAIQRKNLGLEQWAGQISKDALNQASGITNDEIRKEFDMQYVTYIGTIKNTTRPICYHMLTKAKTIKYEDLQKTIDPFVKNGVPSDGKTTDTANGKWQVKGNGIISGTDASNFLIRRGGYNCRHDMLPSTKPPPE